MTGSDLHFSHYRAPASIRNHPDCAKFLQGAGGVSDGNKRIAAMLFLDFLNRNGRLFLPSGETIINDIGLAALALLMAESNPKDKDVPIRLTMNMPARER
jgi:hypothetical protein